MAYIAKNDNTHNDNKQLLLTNDKINRLIM